MTPSVLLPVWLLAGINWKVAPSTPPLVPRSNIGCDEIVIGDVVEFSPNSSRIRRRNRALLQSLAALLEADTSEILLLSIEGYRSPEEGEELALERALQVKDALLELGAPSARLVPLGYDHALWPKRDAEWSERRVEFDVLLGKQCPQQ